MAARLGASERSLRRHLSREGTSLTDILREVRLNSGLALLQTGRVTVGETAYRCGYNSASRFAGLFRERFGVSPSRVAQYNAVLGPPLAGS
ncbi:MAG: helix-turn-helix transcriptional regulator [Pseudodesulfovibrio sp.]|uniref:helix-turn-helix transcriptional regulator n=1 Tax=Pseudodesulfovibrio sp. TaxID=2035812 RepID=UPI003D110344